MPAFMGIIGGAPETGVRIDVSRPREAAAPWRYAGEAVTADARYAVTALVAAEGQVSVEVSGAPEAVAERVRLLLRAAYKHAHDDGQPPPRRVVRWRADVDLAPPRRGG